ncbi:unnamed protein product [Amoebophrya sp. A25]|nr:unnamed protein product [Amoebophrya sp. A25]|eukprot:GSA25T00016390001.1
MELLLTRTCTVRRLSSFLSKARSVLRKPKIISGRSLFIGSKIREDASAAIVRDPELLGPQYAHTRKQAAKESFQAAGRAWKGLSVLEQERWVSAAKRRRLEVGNNLSAAPSGRGDADEDGEEGHSMAEDCVTIGGEAVPVADLLRPDEQVEPDALGHARNDGDQDLQAAVDAGAAEMKEQGFADVDSIFPVPACKILEYWTETDERITAMRRLACSTPSFWGGTPFERSFRQEPRPPPEPVPALGRALRQQIEQKGERGLYAILVGRLEASGGILFSSERAVPIDRKLFIVAPRRGRLRGVHCLKLDENVQEQRPTDPLVYSLPEVDALHPRKVSSLTDALRDFDRGTQDVWFGRLLFLHGRLVFRFEWEFAQSVRFFGPPNPEPVLQNDEYPEEDEDEEILAIRLAIEAREVEMRQAQIQGASGGVGPIYDASALSHIASFGRLGPIDRTQRENDRGGAPASGGGAVANGASHAHSHEPGFRSAADDVARQLALARERLLNIPAVELLPHGFQARVTGGPWLKAETREGAAGHDASWMPRDGIVFDKVVCSGPRAQLRALGWNLSRGWHLHFYGGTRPCLGMALVWAAAVRWALNTAKAVKDGCCTIREQADFTSGCLDDPDVVEAWDFAKALAEDATLEERTQAAGRERPLTAVLIIGRIEDGVADIAVHYGTLLEKLAVA